MSGNDKIVRLHSHGYCTGYITLRLNVPSEFVRLVIEKHQTSAAVRRVKAENKRATALRLLAEADSVLRS
jgi:orotate phosphoribosyltransferase-like protein